MSETKREYATRLGLAKPGRGRMSKAAHEAINKALAEGVKFSDVPGSGNKNATVKSEDSNKPKPEESYGETPERLFNGGWYIKPENKKIKVSGTEVCRSCMTSLDWHTCNLPTFPYGTEMLPVMR